MAFIHLIEPQHRECIPLFFFAKEQRSESLELTEEKKTTGNDKRETKSGISTVNRCNLMMRTFVFSYI